MKTKQNKTKEHKATTTTTNANPGLVSGTEYVMAVSYRKVHYLLDYVF